ncbi:MAG: undecaprenyl/decaprenyl-phosphate alpha-N-acetylglucosaminyl 1-phosphate transferase [Peptococcaceae bacterium]|nr:undecaprenyl/decaprenyl-phosphate alpha-N-acetylglucosaminyl 1-phosphate transferase [Peptococcaceae bacterium]
MQLPLAAILVGLVLAFFATPFVRKLAFKCGAIDSPNERKVHKKTMPRMGGLAIYLSFVLVVLFTQEMTPFIKGLLLGGSLIVLLGIADDIRGISPRLKLSGQIVAALVVVAFGLEVRTLTNPFAASDMIALGVLAIPITVLWLVSVTNAVNLIDGLDGLAGGITTIALLTIAATVWIEVTKTGIAAPGQKEAVVLALILAAAVLGFLPFNFNPARIFLGDTGSMFLGFNLAVLSMMGLAKGPTFISLIIPVVILGIPLLDTTFAVVRRFLGNRPIMQPDKEHLHHRLMEMGLSHRQTVLCIYAISLVLGMSAIVMTIISPKYAMLLLAALSTVIIIAANKLGVANTGRNTPYIAPEPQTEKHQRP